MFDFFNQDIYIVFTFMQLRYQYCIETIECTALQVGTPIVKTSRVVSMDRRDHKLFRDFKNMIHLSVSFAKIVDFKLKIT